MKIKTKNSNELHASIVLTANVVRQILESVEFREHAKRIIGNYTIELRLTRNGYEIHAVDSACDWDSKESEGTSPRDAIIRYQSTYTIFKELGINI